VTTSPRRCGFIGRTLARTVASLQDGQDKRPSKRSATSANCSCLRPAARITFAHFSVNPTMNLPNSAGDVANGSTPKSSRRIFIVGSASTALTSLLRNDTIAAGVSFGAQIPCQPVPSKPGTNPPIGGRSGKASIGCAVVPAAALIAACTACDAKPTLTLRSNCKVIVELSFAAARGHSFERCRDSAGNSLRISARKLGGDHDGRRVDIWQCSHRQQFVADQAEQQDRPPSAAPWRLACG
jgi:hypothetical protein